MTESTPFSDDRLLDRFADLSRTLPSRRPAVNRTPPPKYDIPEGWDEKPVYYMVQGVKKEFFTIQHLSFALGVAKVTIRGWENRGLIPRTPFRSPRPQRETIPGLPPKGKRLWTREQILGVVRIAEEEQVIINGKPPTERFSSKVAHLYQQLLSTQE